MTRFVDQEREQYIIYVDFSKAFLISSHKIFVSKLVHYGLDEWTIRQVKKLVGWLYLEDSK